MQTFDYIIVGGGSAGSILASRLSARSGNQVLLCEAGEDTPDGRVPEPILDSRSGYRLARSAFLWNELRVTTEAMPHNDPDAPRPRLVRYEQARVLGGGSSINGQLANRGSPARLRRMGAARRHRLALGNRAAVLQEDRARHRFRRAAARFRRPHSGAPRVSGQLVRLRQGCRRSVQARRISLRAGPERRVPGRLLPAGHVEPLRPAGICRGRLSRPDRQAARQPDGFDRDAGQRTAVRGHELRRHSRRGRPAARPNSAPAR